MAGRMAVSMVTKSHEVLLDLRRDTDVKKRLSALGRN